MSKAQDLTKLKNLIIDVAGDIPDIVSQMDEAKEWNSIKEVLENINTVGSLVQELVIIGKLGREVMTDIELDDKELINIIADIINEKVDLPWVPEGIENLLFKFGVGMVMKTLDKVWDKIQDSLQDIGAKVKAKIS